MGLVNRNNCRSQLNSSLMQRLAKPCSAVLNSQLGGGGMKFIYQSSSINPTTCLFSQVIFKVIHKRYVVSCFASSFSSSLGSFIKSQALASGLCFLCPCFVVTTMVALPGFLVVVLNMLLWWPLLHHIFSFSKVKTAFDWPFITWDVLVVYPSRVAHYHCVFIYSGCDFHG